MRWSTVLMRFEIVESDDSCRLRRKYIHTVGGRGQGTNNLRPLCDRNNSKTNQAVNVPQIVIINMISPPHYHQLKLIWINNHNLFVFSMMIPVPYWLSVVWWLFLLWFVNSGDCGRFIYVYTSIYNVCLLLRSIECVVCCFDSIQVTWAISFVFCMNNTTGTNTLE